MKIYQMRIYQLLLLPLFLLSLLLAPPPCAAQAADRLTIAAASNLRFALADILAKYQAERPNLEITVVYGASGRLTTQIMNGAPFDLFFSADLAFAEKLYAAGLAIDKPEIHAIGRIVIWSRKFDASNLTLADFTSPAIRRIAIANPAHAPYGKRAREAMQAVGIWAEIQAKLVLAEDVGQAVRMVKSEAAEVGIIALSQALSPGLVKHGHSLIDDSLHLPLLNSYVITRHGRNNPVARDFVRYMAGEEARTIMRKYGFVLPIRQ